MSIRFTFALLYSGVMLLNFADAPRPLHPDAGIVP